MPRATGPGAFEAAAGGTLFLDEIGDRELTLLGVLLRAVQEKQIRRVGDSLPREIGVHVITATNKELRTAQDMKLFREDLLYRIRVGRIVAPLKGALWCGPTDTTDRVAAASAAVEQEGQDELTQILAAIEWAEGNRARAARKLGVSSATPYRRLAHYALPAKRALHAGDQRRTGRPQT